MLSAYYRPAGPTNSAVIVVQEVGEGWHSWQSISPGRARERAEATTDAKFRNELIAAAERYVLDGFGP